MSEEQILVLSLPKEIENKIELLASWLNLPPSFVTEKLFFGVVDMSLQIWEMHKKETANAEVKLPKELWERGMEASRLQGIPVEKEIIEKVYGFLMAFDVLNFFKFVALYQESEVKKILEAVVLKEKH